MQHRNGNTLDGGENMQQTRLAQIRRYMAVILVVVSALALSGCPGDDDESDNVDEGLFNLNSAPVSLNASSGPALVNSSLLGETLDFPNGVLFTAGIDPLSMTFTSANVATFSRSGSASSNAAVGFSNSCTFAVIVPGGVIPVGTYFFPVCRLNVTAASVQQGGGTVPGLVTLTLGLNENQTVTSLNFISVDVSIDANGVLVIDGVSTPVNVESGTGTTGVTGG